MTKIELLFSKALNPEAVRISRQNPRYTTPRTWGVYEIRGTDCGPSSKRFRRGNHPIRHRELLKECGDVKLVALFGEELLAIELAASLNDAD